MLRPSKISGLLHHRLKLLEVEPLEFVPLGHDDDRVGAARDFVGTSAYSTSEGSIGLAFSV
jgi:hypothetical protein